MAKELLFLTEAEIISRVLKLFEETWDDYWNIGYEKCECESPVLTVKFNSRLWYFGCFEAAHVAGILASIEAFIYDCHAEQPIKRATSDQCMEIDESEFLPF